MPEMYRYDLHVHSERSSDARGSILELAEAAQAAGLHGFAVTDHNAVWRDEELQAARDATGLTIFPGCEVSSLNGHILALDVTSPLPKRASLKTTIKAIEDQGGLAVPSHPLKLFSGIGPETLRSAAEDGTLVAAEGRNGRERRLVQQNSLGLVHSLGLAATGGTDAHWIHDIGAVWTELPQHALDGQAVIEGIRAGKCRPGGVGLPRRKVLAHGLTVPARVIKGKKGKNGH